MKLQSLSSLRAIQGTDDVNVAWRVWQSLFKQAVVQFVLLRTVMIRPDNKIWITAHYKTAESIFELFFFFKVQKQGTEENPTSFFFLMPPPRGF